ncbi:GbsR/MarR family transcriptional regulator [Frigoriflavimonas asaccharolytica]|uniref:DNA-binding transcriptional regulator GbsR (MarR family) n=1 Tax=Frigoriflavimonas asaccharolytica TaxID=2735899 RepID=A0A8J8K848_9FLAO|nr:transcriptional regulator [Frigoriflavimonas asaccharolytica]NRS92643.1 DNA-binding transcriptional regulator GbsR (MarR family) [Frigoriflavimonas asaccharolytica]
MEKPFEIDESLYQKLVHFYEESYRLPPLAAKIYSYLTFDFNNVGVTFDEIVELMKASKSSVSSNLNLLQSNGYLSTINKIDNRKRFFILNPDYVNVRFDCLMNKFTKEMEILEGLKKFRQMSETDECSKIYISKLEIYISLLKTNIENFSQTLKKLNQ